MQFACMCIYTHILFV